MSSPEPAPVDIGPGHSIVGRIVRLVTVDTEHGLGTLRNVSIVVWGGETRPEYVHEWHRTLVDLSATKPGGLGVLAVVEERARMPSSEFRRAMIALQGDHATGVKAWSMALEGTGFRATAIRALVASTALILQRALVQGVSPSVEAAADWLAERLPPDEGSTAGAAEIVGAVVALRGRLDEQRGRR